MRLNKLDNKLLKRLGLIVGIIFAIFIGILIFKIITGGRISYTDIESRMITAAKNYYKQNPDKLPKENGGYVIIGTDKLVESKNLKDLSKLVKDEKASCSGEVTVTNNNGQLLYSATLNCGEYYETKKLKNVIIEENSVQAGDGLYNINNSYVFRGEKVNNFVSYAGLTWRILRVNSDGTIRLIETTKRDKVEWDDRYNSEKGYTIGINNYKVSRIRDYITDIYNGETFSDNDKAYLVAQNLCIGKRPMNATVNDGSIECSEVLENQPLGLIQLNEFALASLDRACSSPTDPECTNYNYLLNIGGSYWTLTAAAENTFRVYKISNGAIYSNAANSSQIKLVVNINSSVNYVAGDGSEEKPYTFK